MTATELPEVLTVDELAVFLRLNRKTVYKMVQDGMPGARNVRGTIRIHKPTVLAWMAAGEGPVLKRKRAK